jgi:histidine triad (HIT) family protein
MMQDCLFCKIARGEIPCNKVYEDEDVLAFHDIAPQAKVHVLVIPKQHHQQLDAAEQAMSDAQLAGLLRAAARIARQLGLESTGYRLVTNCGPHACQSVHHLHLHILGGEQLSGNMA